MAGKVAKGKSTTRATGVSGAKRAGIVFAPSRVQRSLRECHVGRIGGSAGVFLAGVLEYLVSEVAECAGNFCDESGMKTIKPKHLQLSFREDRELCKLIADIQVQGGGHKKNVQEFLFPKKGKKAAGEATQEM